MFQNAQAPFLMIDTPIPVQVKPRFSPLINKKIYVSLFFCNDVGLRCYTTVSNLCQLIVTDIIECDRQLHGQTGGRMKSHHKRSSFTILVWHPKNKGIQSLETKTLIVLSIIQRTTFDHLLLITYRMKVQLLYRISRRLIFKLKRKPTEIFVIISGVPIFPLCIAIT